MESGQLYDYLVQAKARNVALVLAFDDSDTYSLSDVDFCFSTGRDGLRENEPLVVAFDDCLNDSHGKLRAYRDGYLEAAGVYWTSTEPNEPVMVEYNVENIVSIWDDVKKLLRIRSKWRIRHWLIAI